MSNRPEPPSSAAVPAQKRRLIPPILWKLGSLLSVLMGIVQFFGWYAPSDDLYVLWAARDRKIATRASYFGVETKIDEVRTSNENVIETEITFWRDQGKPITAEMLRRPLTVQLPSGSKLLAHKIIAAESSVTPNFRVVQGENTLQIEWRIFDPDMAIKVAVARAGAADRISVTNEIGPGVLTSTRRYTTPKVLFLTVCFVLGFVCWMSVILGGGFGVSSGADRFAGWPRYVRWPVWLFALAVLGGLTMGALKAFEVASDWVSEAIVKPIPFR